jgi:hypothetical protein
VIALHLARSCRQPCRRQSANRRCSQRDKSTADASRGKWAAGTRTTCRPTGGKVIFTRYAHIPRSTTRPSSRSDWQAARPRYSRSGTNAESGRSHTHCQTDTLRAQRPTWVDLARNGRAQLCRVPLAVVKRQPRECTSQFERHPAHQRSGSLNCDWFMHRQLQALPWRGLPPCRLPEVMFGALFEVGLPVWPI